MEELKRLVMENLSVEDQALWERVFAVLEGEDRFGFIEFVGGDKAKLEFLTNNLRQKMVALESLDEGKLLEILAEEQNYTS